MPRMEDKNLEANGFILIFKRKKFKLELKRENIKRDEIIKWMMKYILDQQLEQFVFTVL